MQPNTPQTVPGQVHVDRTTILVEKTYYSNLDGATYYFKDGKGARFENGVYTTTYAGEQDELDELCGTVAIPAKKSLVDGKVTDIPAIPGRPRLSHNHMFFNHEVAVQRSDAHVLKEVASGTGVVHTGMLAQLSKQG